MVKCSDIARSFDDLPLIMEVSDIASVMGISRVSAYELVHTDGFPVLTVGRRLKVSKTAFEKWLEKKSKQGE